MQRVGRNQMAMSAMSGDAIIGLAVQVARDHDGCSNAIQRSRKTTPPHKIHDMTDPFATALGPDTFITSHMSAQAASRVMKPKSCTTGPRYEPTVRRALFWEENE